MFVDISDTTVPNLIYVLKMKCYLADDFYLLLSSSQELSLKCWKSLMKMGESADFDVCNKKKPTKTQWISPLKGKIQQS
jgi:hypothetical protein